MPDVLSAGTFNQDGERVFWDVHDPGKVVVIDLADEHFKRLVVEVDDSEAAATAIGKAIGGRSE